MRKPRIRLYPNDLERRIAKRRTSDREGAPGGLDALLPGRRRRPPVLWSGIAKCPGCGRVLHRVRNLSSDGRQHFIVECVFGAPSQRSCSCANDRAIIEWLAQAGTEIEGKDKIRAQILTLFRD